MDDRSGKSSDLNSILKEFFEEKVGS